MKGVQLLMAAFGIACLSSAGLVCGADIVRGAEVYRQHCANCHGATGVSSWPGAPNLARREGLLQPDQALLQVLRIGRGAMPGYLGLLTDADILNAIAYSRTLPR